MMYATHDPRFRKFCTEVLLPMPVGGVIGISRLRKFGMDDAIIKEYMDQVADSGDFKKLDDFLRWQKTGCYALR